MSCYELIGGARLQWETQAGWRNRMAAQAQEMHAVAARRAGFIPQAGAAEREGYDRAAREFMSATDRAVPEVTAADFKVRHLGDKVVCAREGCDAEFALAHNQQKYCGDECRRLDRNARASERSAGDVAVCAYDKCGRRFTLKHGRQKYCTDRCCDYALGRYIPPPAPPLPQATGGGSDVIPDDALGEGELPPLTSEELSATLARADAVNKRAREALLSEARREVGKMTAGEKRAALAGK